MAEKIANFRFKGYKIIESSIKVSSEIEVSPQLHVEFEKTEGINEDERKMRLYLVVSIKDDNNALNILVKAEGEFEFDADLSEETKDTFFKTSAPAILFPYVRAYITTLSSLSGQKPIILPTLNLSNR